MAALNKTKSWISAMRLRTLPLSLSGVIVGAGMAAKVHQFDALIFALIVFATLGLQILSNLANDYGDGIRGTDNDSRIGPSRALQSGVITPKQMLRGIMVCGGVTAVSILSLIYLACYPDYFLLSLLYIGLGIAALVAAIEYTMGPNPYGYKAFGDLMVFIFFGVVSVMGSYVLFVKTWSVDVFAPAIAIGFLSVSVLNLNNMRDIESDRSAGKRTVALMLGLNSAKKYHSVLGLGTLLALVYFLWPSQSYWPYIVNLLAFLPLFRHYLTVWFISDAEKFDPQLKVVALSTFALAISMSLTAVYLL